MRINTTQRKNNITFQSKIIKNNEIKETFEYNKELLNKNEFTKVASFCRGLESIFERGPKDTICNLSSEIKRHHTFLIGTWYSIKATFGNIKDSGGLNSFMQSRNYQEACNLEKSLLTDVIIRFGEIHIKNDCNSFADKKFEEHVFQNLNKFPEKILSDYGKKLWNETKFRYDRSYSFGEYYHIPFANIFKAQDELKTVNNNDIERIDNINKKIKAEIREIINDDYQPIYYSYKRKTPQILNKTIKDFRQFYTGESKNTYEFRNFLNEYNQSLKISSQNPENVVQTRTNIIKFLNNWINSLENNKNLIKLKGSSLSFFR